MGRPTAQPGTSPQGCAAPPARRFTGSRLRPAAARGRAVLVAALGLGMLVLVVVVVGALAGGGSSSGLASSYSCSLPNGASATIDFTDTGSSAGEPQGSGEYAPLAGDVTGPQGVIESFSHGTFERGHVDFGLVNDSDDPAGLGGGATLENGKLVLAGGQITCT